MTDEHSRAEGAGAGKLRRALASVEFATLVEPGRSAEILREAQRQRRRRQRQSWATMATAAAVVMLAAAVLVGLPTGSERPVASVRPAPVAQWPARGGLADNQRLIDRASQAWRAQDRRAPRGPMRVLFAGSMAGSSEPAIVVALTGMNRGEDGRVGFVTTDLGLPPGSRVSPAAPLVLRSTMRLDPGTPVPGIGFAAANPVGTEPEADPVGFALLTPGAGQARFVQALSDMDLQQTQPATRGALWQVLMPDSSAATTRLEIPLGPRGRMRTGLTSGAHDTPLTPVHVTPAGNRQLAVTGGHAKPGALVLADTGVLGSVTSIHNGHARISTDLAALPGRERVAASTVFGEVVTDSHGRARFVPKTAGPISPGSRVVLTNPSSPEVTVNLGRLQRGEHGWLIRRAAPIPAGGPIRALLIGGDRR